MEILISTCLCDGLMSASLLIPPSSCSATHDDIYCTNLNSFSFVTQMHMFCNALFSHFFNLQQQSNFVHQQALLGFMQMLKANLCVPSLSGLVGFWCGNMVKLLNVNPRTGNRANNLILNGMNHTCY